MQEQLKNRLEELKEEFDRGKKRLEALDAEANELRQTLLRISGAIQVLEEELKKPANDRPRTCAHTASAGIAAISSGGQALRSNFDRFGCICYGPELSRRRSGEPRTDDQRDLIAFNPGNAAGPYRLPATSGRATPRSPRDR
jgi:hypothetical protein